MNAKENAPTGTAIPMSAGAEKAAGNTSIPISNYTTGAAHGQPLIADFLGHDRESARKGWELCAALHMDSRTLRQQIERERRAGALIVSDNKNGYWLTDDPAEAQAFARSMRHRARQIVKIAQAVERGAGLD